MTLILASSSPYRRELLLKAGYNPVIIKPNVDESITKKKYLKQGPIVIAQKLARLKSEQVLSQLTFDPPYMIIGSDQVCAFGETIYDKPGDFQTNFKHLQSLQNATHSLITAVCILVKHSNHAASEYFEFFDQTDLTMRALTDAEITTYLNLDKPFDCAGGYKFESYGHTLMQNINSKDISAIQGLPMKQCQQIIDKFIFH